MQKITRAAALLLVLLAVALAVLAIALGRHATKASNQAMAVATATTGAVVGTQAQGASVAVAATVLPPGVPIAPDALRMATWPQRPVGAYADTAALAGSIPLVRIPAGTPVLASLLAKGVAMALQPGERAMAVPVDEQAGVGNRIHPGDYVDVFLSLKTAPDAGYGKPTADATQTRLLLSRLRVLAYGDENLPAQSSSDAGDNGKKATTARADDASRAAPRTAVLAVPVQDADRLLLGVQNGKLSLALRRPDDPGQPDHALFPQPRTVLAARSGLSPEQKQSLELPENRAYAGINGQGLAGHAPTPPPRSDNTRRAPAWHGVEVIRGTSDADTRVNRTSSP